ncbi:MAG: ArsR/SmtB family transcription factor [Jiangellaceae bacterium]
MQTYRSGSQLDALGDPTRRAIVELLAAGPSPVGRLADLLPVSRPAVSQHLRVLKDAGLVRSDAVGTRRLYRLDPRGPAELRAYLDRFWTTALAAFAEAVAIDAARNRRSDAGGGRSIDHTNAQEDPT